MECIDFADFTCAWAIRDGFLSGCRSILGLDGCHLRGPNKGILLSTAGLDPNNSLYPLAITVEEIEKRETGTWFLQILIEDLRISDEDRWTLMTDKQKVLVVFFSCFLNVVFLHITYFFLLYAFCFFHAFKMLFFCFLLTIFPPL